MPQPKYVRQCHKQSSEVEMCAYPSKHAKHVLVSKKTKKNMLPYFLIQKCFNDRKKGKLTSKYDLCGQVDSNDHSICPASKDQVSCFWIGINLQLYNSVLLPLDKTSLITVY